MSPFEAPNVSGIHGQYTVLIRSNLRSDKNTIDLNQGKRAQSSTKNYVYCLGDVDKLLLECLFLECRDAVYQKEVAALLLSEDMALQIEGNQAKKAIDALAYLLASPRVS